MNVLKLPSGEYVNLDRAITVKDARSLAEDMSKRRAVEVVTDGDGSGRCFYDDDADAILAWFDRAATLTKHAT